MRWMTWRLVSARSYDVAGPEALPPHFDPLAPFDFLPEEAERLERASALAEFLPEHKHAAVAVLRRRGWTVGACGDGVDDAYIPPMLSLWYPFVLPM